MRAPRLGRGGLGASLLALGLLLGCGEVAPLGRRPRSDQFLTPAQLADQMQPGTPREAVRARFGPPFAERTDGSALAYLTHISEPRTILTLAVVVPFWHQAKVAYYQVRGVWFDREGRVVQTLTWDGHDGPHGGNPYGPGFPTQAQVLRWLEEKAPGPGRP